MMSRRVLFAGAAALPVVGLVGPGEARPPVKLAQSSATRSRFAPRRSGREILRERYFPNIDLVTSEGRKVKFYDDLIKDKIVILNLMYAECDGVCPTTTANLKSVRKILRKEVKHDIFIYSLTLKPEHDTPEALNGYARMHGIHDPDWLLLTGKPNDMDLLRHKIGFADPNPEIDRDKSRHSGMLRYGNEPMAIWGTCQGSAEPEWIAQEIGFAIPRELKLHPRVNE
jgi:protein SCO1